jgi:hypothetical protein
VPPWDCFEKSVLTGEEGGGVDLCQMYKWTRRQNNSERRKKQTDIITHSKCKIDNEQLKLS